MNEWIIEIDDDFTFVRYRYRVIWLRLIASSGFAEAMALTELPKKAAVVIPNVTLLVFGVSKIWNVWCQIDDVQVITIMVFFGKKRCYIVSIEIFRMFLQDPRHMTWSDLTTILDVLTQLQQPFQRFFGNHFLCCAQPLVLPADVHNGSMEWSTISGLEVWDKDSNAKRSDGNVLGNMFTLDCQSDTYHCFGLDTKESLILIGFGYKGLQR